MNSSTYLLLQGVVITAITLWFTFGKLGKVVHHTLQFLTQGHKEATHYTKTAGKVFTGTLPGSSCICEVL